jgi:hypothetical protein
LQCDGECVCSNGQTAELNLQFSRDSGVFAASASAAIAQFTGCNTPIPLENAF